MNGKYARPGAGEMIRSLERSRERAAAGSGDGNGLAIVSPDEPTDPPTGQLWYDTDATC